MQLHDDAVPSWKTFETTKTAQQRHPMQTTSLDSLYVDDLIDRGH